MKKSKESATINGNDKPTYEQLEAKVKDVEFRLKGAYQLLASERAAHALLQARANGLMEAFRTSLYDAYLREATERGEKGPMAYEMTFRTEIGKSNADSNFDSSWKRVG